MRGLFVRGFLLYLQLVQSTHYFAGNIYWERHSTLQNTVSYYMQLGFRRDWGFPAARGTQQGGHKNLGDQYRVDGVTGKLKIIDKVTSTETVKVIEPVTVIAHSAQANWQIGRFQWDFTLPDANNDYEVRYVGCCRLQTYTTPRNENYWLFATRVTLVNAQRLGSPRTSGVPREFATAGTNINFAIPITHPNQLPVTVKFPEPETEVFHGRRKSDGTGTWGLYDVDAVTGSGFHEIEPGTGEQKFPPFGLTLDVAAKKIEWTAPQFSSVARNNLYAVQVLIEEVNDLLGDGSVSIAYDFLFEVKAACQTSNCNNPPYFSPPSAKLFHQNVCLCGSAECNFCPFVRGVETTISINIYDVDSTQTLNLVDSGKPEGSQLTVKEQGTRTNDPYGSNGQFSWKQYEFKWRPPIDAVDEILCLQAQDSGDATSINNYCLILKIVESESIYVSGIIRDFTPDHMHFGLDVDEQSMYVASTLGADGKPVATDADGNPVANPAFDQWFNTVPDVNEATVTPPSSPTQLPTHSSPLFGIIQIPTQKKERSHGNGSSHKLGFFDYSGQGRRR